MSQSTDQSTTGLGPLAHGPLVLRPTGVQCYVQCPRKFFATYIENTPRLVSAALAIGSAFHKGTEILVAALKARRRPVEVLEAAEATFDEALAFERTLGDPDPDDAKFETAKDVGIGLLRAAAEAIPQDWCPASVEETAEAAITDDIVVRGTTDLVLDDGTVVDFKTRARKSDDASIRRDLQFTAYALIRATVDGTDGAPRKVAIVEVTKTKVPAVHIHETERTRADFDVYRGIVAKVGAAIRAGYDVPAPSPFCSSCGYRAGLCPLGRMSRSPW